MLTRLLIFAFFTMTVSAFAQTAPPIESGVSQTLAKWRAANYSDVRYKLNITLEKGAPLMKGDIEIRVNFSNTEISKREESDAELIGGSNFKLILDWRKIKGKEDSYSAQKITLNGKRAEFKEVSEHLIIENAVNGENIVKLEFTSPISTSGSAITRYVDKEDNSEYVYSLFVPSDASTAFPCFDQPDLKAKFSLTVRSYSFNKVVSNTKEKQFGSVSSSTLVGGFPHVFDETKPISTYVFAFAAGDFAEFDESTLNSEKVKTKTISGINFDSKDKNSKFKLIDNPETLLEDINQLSSKIYVRKSQAEKFKQHAAEVFRLNREGVKFLESWFDYKFPFPKYDLVLIPEFPFGGMEHAGATFLREDRIIFPTEPTKNDYITRANVIFHEAAHQWFGDTVTMRWFDDLWLKEGFAEFMAYKTLEKVMPEYNAWKIFYERNKQLAYLTDSTRGTTPIYQEIPNLSAAKSAYGNIVYRKAPSFLRQAEFFLGEDKFQTAVRAFLKKHEFANAEWTDLVKEFEDAAWLNHTRGNYDLMSADEKISEEKWSRKDINIWANNWVKQRGLSIIRVVTNVAPFITRTEPSPTAAFDFKKYIISQRSAIGEKNLSDQKFRILLNYEGLKNPMDFTIKRDEKTSEFNLSSMSVNLKRKTKLEESSNFIFPNYEDYGYGIFLLDKESRNHLIRNIQNEKDDFLRAMMWGSLWDSVREAELAPRDYVALVIKNINVETDESTIQTLLARVSTAMNYYLSDKQREELAPQIETLLIDKMQNALTLGQRITFYRAFLNTASSEKARTYLKDILSGKSQIKDLKLKTKDKFDIITRLAVLDDADAPKLLVDLSKTETSDEAKRYAYAAQAGFPSTENAAKFYNDFVGNKDISESYIESAFVPFNSVRHSELTLPYLEKALTELPNLKRSRKIFFVNGWLSAFIGGQKSEQALAIVNKFLADNPNLDKDLRLKVLETSDALERAVKIRAKYAK